MSAHYTYDRVADFIAALNPKQLLELRADADMQARLEALIEQEKTASLTPEEKDELDHYIVLERLIRLMKANALSRLMNA
jgi:hypothetical protein